jgi:hypothetical protein
MNLFIKKKLKYKMITMQQQQQQKEIKKPVLFD